MLELLKAVEGIAKGLKDGPLPFFLAITLVALVLLYRGARKREKELTKELVEQERLFRAEVERVRKEHVDQMTMLITTTHGVLELKAELEHKIERRETKKHETPKLAEGGG